MENIFNYQSVPRHYTYCFNRQCARNRECLRHLVAAKFTAQQATLTVVNPNRIPSDTSTWPYFQTILVVRLAWGVKYIFDDVPYKTAKTMWKKIIAHFGKTLTPEDQEYIHQIFKEQGITRKPESEVYTEEINFMQG